MDRETSILVTGGTGFLGMALCDRLSEKGFANYTAVGSGEYDLRNQAECLRLFLELKPDMVFHLAAVVGGIGANMKAPADFWYENQFMGANIIKACASSGVDRLLIVGTTCSYPKFCKIPFSETSLWDGYPEETNAPYGIAKKSLYIGAKAFKQQYGLDCRLPIMTNMYGIRDNFDLETSHVIPAMIRKFHDAKKKGYEHVTLYGDGSPTRDFLNVKDGADALIACMASDTLDCEPINFGSGKEVPIRMLAEIIRDVVGYEGEIKWDTSKPNGQPRRALDTNRAWRTLGWQPKIALEDGLKEVYEWFVDSFDCDDEGEDESEEA